MESSRTVTSIFMAVTVITMAILAYTASKRNVVNEAATGSQPAADYILAGLGENLRSLQRITGFPSDNIQSVRVIRTNGEELRVTRIRPAAAEFVFTVNSAENSAPFSAILIANAALLDEQESPDSFMVTGYELERRLGQLVYSSFDGLIIEQTIYLSDESIWAHFLASYNSSLAKSYATETADLDLYSPEEIENTINQLNGRVYAAKSNPE